MNKAFLYAGAFIIGSFVGVSQATTISLSESVERALSVDLRNKLQENNLVSSKAGLEAAKQGDTLKTTLNVKVGADTDKSLTKSRRINLDNSLVVTKKLYDGGFTKSSVDMAKSRVNISKKTIQLSQAKVASEVVKEYINLLRLRAMQKSLSKSYMAIKDLRDEYKRRVDSGVGQNSILARLEQKVGMLEIGMDDFSNQLKNVEDKLRYLLQVDDNFILDLEPIKPVDPTAIALIRNAVENNDVDSLKHPEFLKIRDQIDVAGHDYDAKKAGYSPAVDLEGKVTMKRAGETASNSGDVSMFLKVTWNLSNEALKYRVKEKEIVLKNARVEQAFVRNKILSDLRMGVRSLDNLTNTFVKMQKIHQHVINIERDSYVRFTTLAKQGQEYLSRADVVNEFYTSETKMLSGYYEKTLIEYSLMNTAGTLLRYFEK